MRVRSVTVKLYTKGPAVKTILFGAYFCSKFQFFLLISRLCAPPLLPLLSPLLLHLRPLALPTLPGTGGVRAGKLATKV